MKRRIRLFTTVMVCMAMALCVSCKKDDNNNPGGGGTQTVATVTTNNVTDIIQTTATCGGEVTSDGGAAVTARGVCWSTSQNPTVSDSHTTDGSGTGSFTSNITGLTENTTYYVRAYATNSEGTSYGEQKSFTTLSGGGGDHDYVDLGLPSGLLWATCNVGASKPEEYGDYYAWGEVLPYYADGHSQDNPCSTWRSMTTGAGNTVLTSGYAWQSYSQGGTSSFAEWTQKPYGSDNILASTRDAATANWGGGWRMPSAGEWQELYDNTDCTWTTENGVAGRKFTSKTDSSKYIFLPAAGYRDGTSLKYAGSLSYYWSSSLDIGSPDNAYFMSFYSGSVYPQNYDDRYYGFTVRPVCAAR